MTATPQISELKELHKALIPLPNMVDGRTDEDRLAFMVRFSSLLNFYDKSNEITSDWSPFLLKDPIFLLAFIAKTPFPEIHQLFVESTVVLGNSLVTLKSIPSTRHSSNEYIRVNTSVSNGFEQVLEQLIRVFRHLEKWSFFLNQNTHEFKLKTYILNEIRTKYSIWFWDVLDLKQQLATSKYVEGIIPVDYFLFEKFDNKIWKKNKGKYTFYDLLNLEYPLQDNTKIKILNGLKKVGQELLSFFNSIVEYASVEFENSQIAKKSYPDTLLFRTFSNLFETYTKQINGFSKRHLNFYYGDILKQHQQLATPDSTFVYAQLAKKELFSLPTGTAFNAGVNNDKEPIVFKNDKSVSLNPATITSGYTLMKSKGDGGAFTTLYLSNIETPSILKKDEQGAIVSWDTFGTTNNATQVAQSIAFASPLLFLNEGERTITFSFALQEEIPQAFFEKATYFLSTAEDWLALKLSTPEEIAKDKKEGKKQPIEVKAKDCSLTITINLTIEDPAIVPFAKAKEGYSTQWPIFKMSFNEFKSLSSPPEINTLTIDVNVTGLKNVVLYNDYGALATKKPFQPLGPTPANDESFYLGSNEIFSKKVSKLSIALDWDNLPQIPKSTQKGKTIQLIDAFSYYYEAYNKYLAGGYKKYGEEEDASNEKKSSFWDKIFSKKNNKQGIIDAAVDALVPFNNESFQVAFELLQYGKWDAFNMNNPNGKGETKLYELKGTEDGVLYHQPLFQFDSKTLTLSFDKEINATITLVFDISYNYLTKKVKLSVHLKINDKSLEVYDEVPQRGITPNKLKSLLANLNSKLSDSESEIKSYLKANEEKIANDIIQFILKETISSKSTFTTNQLSTIQTDLDPSLQLTPLLFSNTSKNGFLRMQLIAPSYGFGVELYPKVVNAIALCNAEAIALTKKKDIKELASTANIPYTPIVSGVTADYGASHTYDFLDTSSEYPIEISYETPFTTFNYSDLLEQSKTAYPVLAGDTKANGAIPLYPECENDGQLFIELSDLVAPCQLSLYFELNRAFSKNINAPKGLNYLGATSTGWETIKVVEDGTKGFSCSGILLLDIPDTLSDNNPMMPLGSYWLAIGTTESPSQFATTSLLSTNGIKLTRSGDNYITSEYTPKIAASTIKSTLPELSSVLQPFSSFGGVAYETKSHMNKRVSLRLQTKDRLVTATDYYRIIKNQFPTIYYSKSEFKTKTRNTEVYVVHQVEHWSDNNAFRPLVSECLELNIQNFLKARASTFANIEVSNFDFQYVRILGVLTLNEGYEKKGAMDQLNSALNIFLSPWVKAHQEQIIIDSGLTVAEIAAFINGFLSIDQVEDLQFEIGKLQSDGTILYEAATSEVKATKRGKLLVPSLDYSKLKYQTWKQ